MMIYKNLAGNKSCRKHVHKGILFTYFSSFSSIDTENGHVLEMQASSSGNDCFLKSHTGWSPRSEKHLQLFNLEDKLEDQPIKERVIK